MSIAGQLADAVRAELGRALAGLCDDTGAAESSLLLPRGGDELVFFASSNPALTRPGVPAVPMQASFAGLAFRTGQTIAYADAAGQAAHFAAVDEHVSARTREYAAVACIGGSVTGVLTLVNRRGAGTEPRPFTLDELRRAEALARELAPPLLAVAGLLGSAAEAAVDPALLADLSALTEAERRIVGGLAASLIENRSA